MKKHSGFTLLELLITLAIVGIVAAFGAPAMSSFIKNDRLVTQINTLVTHLAYARSEAVVRHQQVILCASTNSDTASPSCSGSKNDWAKGWILFIDADNSSTFNTGEVVLRVNQSLSPGTTLVSTAALNSIIYDTRGFSVSSGAFILCDDRGKDYVKSISISNTGRVRLAQKGEVTSCS